MITRKDVLFMTALIAILPLSGCIGSSSHHSITETLKKKTQISASPEKEFQYFRIKNTENSLTFGSEVRDQKRTLLTSKISSLYKKLSLYETLNTDWKGSIYHPNLFEFDSFLEIMPEQSREKTQNKEDKSYKNNLFTGYRLRATFLKLKPYNVSFFANRRRGVRNSDIFDRRTSDYSNYGSTINYRNLYAPMNASYHHDEQRIESTLTPLQHLTDDTFSYHTDSSLKLSGKTYLDYELHNFVYDENNIHFNEGTSQTVYINSDRRLGKSKKKSLFSDFRYYSLTGDREMHEISLNEKLGIEHSRNLKSYYQYGLSDNRFELNDNLTQYVAAGVSHQLFESLWSTLDAKGTLTTSDEYDETVGEISLNEDYRKTIGPALFEIEAGAGYEDAHRDIHQGRFTIFREPHALNDSAIVFLNETGVDPSSIVVTNQLGVILFRDSDYVIIDLGGKVEIRRLPGSRVSNNEIVYVDYSVNNPATNYSLLRKQLMASLGFWNNLVRFYYHLTNEDFLDIQGGTGFLPNAYDDTLYGIENHYRFLRSRVEYEEYDSILFPYTAFRVDEDLSWDLWSRSHVSLGGNYEKIYYTIDERKRYSVRGVYLWNLTFSTSLNTESGYRWERGLGSDLTEYVVKISLRTRYRKLECELLYELDKGTYNDTRFTDHYGIVKIKRTF